MVNVNLVMHPYMFHFYMVALFFYIRPVIQACFQNFARAVERGSTALATFYQENRLVPDWSNVKVYSWHVGMEDIRML